MGAYEICTCAVPVQGLAIPELKKRIVFIWNRPLQRHLTKGLKVRCLLPTCDCLFVNYICLLVVVLLWKPQRTQYGLLTHTGPKRCSVYAWQCLLSLSTSIENRGLKFGLLLQTLSRHSDHRRQASLTSYSCLMIIRRETDSKQSVAASQFQVLFVCLFVCLLCVNRSMWLSTIRVKSKPSSVYSWQ